eukprot:742044-Hanusia_phi.AAC.1
MLDSACSRSSEVCSSNGERKWRGEEERAVHGRSGCHKCGDLMESPAGLLPSSSSTFRESSSLPPWASRRRSTVALNFLRSSTSQATAPAPAPAPPTPATSFALSRCCRFDACPLLDVFCSHSSVTPIISPPSLLCSCSTANRLHGQV